MLILINKIYVNDEQVNHIDYFHSKTGYIPQNHLIISDRIINNITLSQCGTSSESCYEDINGSNVVVVFFLKDNQENLAV